MDADVAVAEEEEEEVAGVEAAVLVWVFPRLDEPGVLGGAGACFAGVLGPAIPFFLFSFALNWSNSVQVSVVVGSKGSALWGTRRLDHERCRCGRGPVWPFSGERVYLALARQTFPGPRFHRQ